MHIVFDSERAPRVPDSFGGIETEARAREIRLDRIENDAVHENLAVDRCTNTLTHAKRTHVHENGGDENDRLARELRWRRERCTFTSTSMKTRAMQMHENFDEDENDAQKLRWSRERFTCTRASTRQERCMFTRPSMKTKEMHVHENFDGAENAARTCELR
ncbi:hypothetical protein PoB_006357100 [Plakobranchus ocellatus]|uniref:Uncharacterized protein n=1 Tax=Plakobranchus ocellatus TaxID=259542 RepID=A0AAV4CZA0_9GAST|nr:hypothetical protein PoB_006357100 [Plakobranchus ocellatus]